MIVDDMYVVLRAYDLSDPKLSVSHRIGHSMQHAGVSILFTSITDLIAFLLGSVSPFGVIY